MKVKFMATDSLHSANFYFNREHGTEDYLFVLFKSPAMLWIENDYVEVDNGNCIIFDKKTKQNYYARNEIDFLHDFIHFDTEAQHEIVLLESLPKNKPILLLLPSRISASLSNIEKEMHFSSEYQKEIVSSLCTAFLYLLKNETDKSDKFLLGRKYYRKLYELRMEIYKSPSKTWNLDVATNMVFLSRSYFQHTYKKFFGVSFIDDVIKARISYAKTLLVNENFSILEIAEACGYQSAEHFIRQFSKVVGLTPHQYRKER